ncbi:PREDICTED: uncharacterized protein LOC106811799 [Priapulus caudatus]|uniref:Uncharacterized protein LOC106811799 n=1 Tax=Priapulus caudatus TaxID=37621 RepID=A0ABM1EFN4_PRICU|nr:PREDICTED: uncharacterized protein LOC106811799 [Priapulus caudatus]
MTAASDVSTVELYCRALRILHGLFPAAVLVPHVQKLVSSTVHRLETLSKVDEVGRPMCQLACTMMLSTICEAVVIGHNDAPPCIVEELPSIIERNLYREDLARIPGSMSHAERGRLVSLYTEAKWTCIRFALTHCCCGNDDDTSWDPAVVVLQRCVDGLSTASGMAIVSLLRVTEVLMHRVDLSGGVVIEVVTAAWNTVQDQWRNHACFWKILEAAVPVVFHEKFMRSPDVPSTILETFNKHASSLRDSGEHRSGVFNVLVRHCCAVWHTDARSMQRRPAAGPTRDPCSAPAGGRGSHAPQQPLSTDEGAVERQLPLLVRRRDVRSRA